MTFKDAQYAYDNMSEDDYSNKKDDEQDYEPDDENREDLNAECVW
jgi:hypothetical protein